MATATELRTKLVNYAKSYIGCKQGDAKHKRIIDIFNSINPLPDGWKMTYKASWCAAFTSACAHACNLDKIIPESANCGTLITKAKKMKCWNENDNYTPLPGDLILYDWRDTGIGDNKGAPDHVGIVADVDKSVIRIIEGNKGNNHECAYRIMSVGGKYIRGYIVPKYESIATKAKIYATGEGQRTGTRVYSAPSFTKPINEIIPYGKMVYCYGTHKAELFEWWKINTEGTKWVRKTSLKNRKVIK